MGSTGSSRDKLELIAQKSFPGYEDMYKVVDFLNKNLKDQRIMFGLARDDKENRVTISIYQY